MRFASKDSALMTMSSIQLPGRVKMALNAGDSCVVLATQSEGQMLHSSERLIMGIKEHAKTIQVRIRLSKSHTVEREQEPTFSRLHVNYLVCLISQAISPAILPEFQVIRP